MALFACLGSCKSCSELWMQMLVATKSPSICDVTMDSPRSVLNHFGLLPSSAPFLLLKCCISSECFFTHGFHHESFGKGRALVTSSSFELGRFTQFIKYLLIILMELGVKYNNLSLNANLFVKPSSPWPIISRVY